MTDTLVIILAIIAFIAGYSLGSSNAYKKVFDAAMENMNSKKKDE